jgi:dTDP-4-amino-4,6-dideoxygalactose transaminase
MIGMAKPVIGTEEKQAVLNVLDSGILAQGPVVQAFEEAFARMCATRNAVAVTSGTAALHVALLAHGIGPGDEVITSAFSFIATANAALYTGARPVFVDIDPQTYNLNPALIEAAITPRTRAILPVHLYGLPCDMDPILEIARRHNLAVIEDACQSHGATYRGRLTGSFGTGAFSLYATKNITSGEGGMITTSDEAIAERCRVLRSHGMRRRYYHDELGYNYRMTDIHAAIGLAQLPKLEAHNQARRRNAAFYSQTLQSVVPPCVPEDRTHVFNQYTVRVPDGRRDDLQAFLKARGVATEVYYPVPIHQQSFYHTRYDGRFTLPETERAAREVLSLPIHPGLSPADLEVVAAAVNDFMGG